MEARGLGRVNSYENKSNIIIELIGVFMLKKIIFLLVLCLGLSPVFIDTEYALNERVRKDQSYIYFDIHVWPWYEFNYYLFYSEFKYIIHKESFSFVIQDYGKNVESFKILSMSSNIDNNIYNIKDFTGDNVLLDKSNGNGYGGDAGVATYSFVMPKIPENKFDIKVNGIITYENSDKEEVSIVISNTINRKKDRKFFLKYQIEKLNF